MAANLGVKADGSVAMAYAGKVPWHQTGVSLGDVEVLADKMYEAAGLGYRVDLADLTTRHRGKAVDVPARKALVRHDTGAVLGVVSNDYGPIQNLRMKRFLESLVGKGRAVYHAGGVIGEGEKSWLLLKLPESGDVVPGDTVHHYIAALNSFGQGQAFRVLETAVRVVCENTWNMADSQLGGYRMLHIRDAETKLSPKDAREVLGMAKRSFEAHLAQCRELAALKLTDRQVDGFVQRVLPLPAEIKLLAPPKPVLLLPEPSPDQVAEEFRIPVQHVLSRREELKALIYTGRGNDAKGVRGTRWAAFNGATEYADFRTSRVRDRAESAMVGMSADLKDRAWRTLYRTDDLFQPITGRGR